MKQDPREAETEPKSEGIYEEEPESEGIYNEELKSEGVYNEELKSEGMYNEEAENDDNNFGRDTRLTIDLRLAPSDDEIEPKSEGAYNNKVDSNFNEDGNFDHEASEAIEEDDHELDDSQVDGKFNYSMNQDEFIEDATAARVI